MTNALKDACARELHVIGQDGSVRTGADAVLFVYEGLGYGALAAPFRLPGLRAVAAQGYRVVAANRRRLAPFLFRKPE